MKDTEFQQLLAEFGEIPLYQVEFIWRLAFERGRKSAQEDAEKERQP